MFKTELHCHSADVSECATADVHSLVEAYVQAGYSTVVLTNHFNPSTYAYLKCKDWTEWIDKYVDGYRRLKECAAGKLEILLGAELRFDGNINDYLLYGLTESFLREHEFMFRMRRRTFHKLASENGILFIQAHPFRDRMSITPPPHLDGIEVYNGSGGGYYGADSRNDFAEAWANRFGLLKTSGTDLHYPDDTVNGGILTEEKITSVEQLVDVLKSGRYQLIRGE